MLTLRGGKGPRRGAELRDLGIIADGSLLIRDGIIEEIGPTRRLENLAAAKGAIEINAGGRVVMPGFIDSHTHLVFPPPGNGLGGDLAAAHAIRTGNCLRIETRLHGYLEAMARHGTTTVEAKTGSGADSRCETKILRVLAGLKNRLLEVVPTFLFRLPRVEVHGEAGVEAAAEAVLREYLPKIRRRGTARFADLAWDPDPARLPLLVRYLEVARSLGMACKLHADQGDPAVPIGLALRHSAVSIDHLEYATTADAALLAGSPTVATLLPSASFCKGGRYALGRALIDAGAAVALATNFNPHHTPTLNMQTVVSLACMRLGMTAAEAISAVTINGAHALGCADRVGSLEVGKSADLVILSLSDYSEVAHHFGINHVHMTMKRGVFIYEEGEVATRRPRDFGDPVPVAS